MKSLQREKKMTCKSDNKLTIVGRIDDLEAKVLPKWILFSRCRYKNITFICPIIATCKVYQ